MELTLTANERELLLEVLEEHHRELLREIAKAKHHEFKTVLQNKVSVLEGVIRKIENQHWTNGMLRSA